MGKALIAVRLVRIDQFGVTVSIDLLDPKNDKKILELGPYGIANLGDSATHESLLVDLGPFDALVE